MFFSAIHLKFFEHSIRKFVFRKHPFHCVDNNELGAFLTEVGHTAVLLISHVTGIKHVFFLLFLITSKFDFVGISNDHIITGVNMWGISWLISTTEGISDADSESSKYLVGS